MEIRDLLDQTREVLENYSSRNAKFAFCGEGQGLCKVLGKYLVYVDPLDTSVAPHLIMDGYWESWITQVLSRLPRGIRCADVGANHGYYTLILADLCENEVWSFEPQEKLANLIRKSSNANGFRKSVHVLSEVVGAPGGEEVFLQRVPGEPNNLGAVSFSREPIIGTRWIPGERGMLIREGRIASSVPSESPRRPVTLDKRIPGELGFIKIDAEGSEPQIWAGMERHLQSRPTILLEFTPRSYPDAGGFLSEIEKCYTLREIDKDGNVVPATREHLLSTEEFAMLWLEKDR